MTHYRLSDRQLKSLAELRSAGAELRIARDAALTAGNEPEALRVTKLLRANWASRATIISEADNA